MSKKTKSTSAISYQPNPNLPKLDIYQTSWNLSGLYYKNGQDPEIEKDTEHAVNTYHRFAKSWKTKAFTSDANVLAKALADYERLAGDPRLSKPGRYFSLRAELDAHDDEAEKALSLLRKRLRKATDSILFFTLELGKIPTKTQKAWLKEPVLKPYRYYLTQLFKGAKHDLTEAEEKIVRLKSAQSSLLWQQMTDKLVSTSTITYAGKTLHLPEAFEMIETLKSAEKPKLWRLLIEKIDTFGIPAEHEFNAIITDVRTEDELRGYEKPYSATALAYEHDEKSIETLVATMSDKGFALSRKFYQLKAAYHGVTTIDYSQKYDTIGQEPEIDFAEALTICRDVFYDVNPLYGQIFDQMIKNGQLDVFPKKGKRGGAFMSDQTGHPVQVMLNHTSTLKALETLAHEMGHAIHATRSATNSPLYDGHSIVAAETASTLFENLVFNAIIASAAEETKIVLLHDKITRDIATMQRQIAFFNCEFEIHSTIAEKGSMTHDELKKCMYKHLTSYLGKAVMVRPEDGASYVYIPHLRYGFYVYSYTFGHLMSSVMAKRYKEDNNYRQEIDTFLTAGSSDTVINIFKRIDIDTTKPETFTLALKEHEKDIQTFAKLVNKRKRTKM